MHKMSSNLQEPTAGQNRCSLVGGLFSGAMLKRGVKVKIDKPCQGNTSPVKVKSGLVFRGVERINLLKQNCVRQEIR